MAKFKFRVTAPGGFTDSVNKIKAAKGEEFTSEKRWDELIQNQVEFLGEEKAKRGPKPKKEVAEEPKDSE